MNNTTFRFIIILSLLLPLLGAAQYVPGQSYFGANNYIEYIAGDLPIILVAPHGGYLEPDSLPTILNRGRDNGTLETTLLLMDSILTQTNGHRPHVIINHLFAGKMSASDEIDSAAGAHPDARQAWNDFHDFIEDAKSEVTNVWSKGHYFEMHGNGHSEMWSEIGLGVSAAYLNGSDSLILSRIERSTVKNLASQAGADFLEIIRGETSLGGLLDARGWNAVPSPSHPAPGAGGFFYAGWNTWLHGSRYEGTIDATHLENYFVFMQSGNREAYAADLAESMLAFMEIHYGLALGIDQKAVEIPARLELYQNYPNPFNPSTNIRYEIPVAGDVRIVVYDLAGREVSVLLNASLSAGSYSVQWHGTDQNGVKLASGVYFVKLLAGDLSRFIRLSLIS